MESVDAPNVFAFVSATDQFPAIILVFSTLQQRAL